MNSLRRRLTIRALFVLLLCGTAHAEVPSPQSVLGFRPGDDRKLADWGQVLDYFHKVSAAAPDRVKFDELGKSTLGKPFVLLTISSPENLRDLERYRKIQARLADPRGLSDAEADRLIGQGKVVVLITCTVHSTEVASTQTALEYVYKLVTEDTPQNQTILNNAIFLLVPSLNPDGQDLVVQWYRKYVGTPFEGTAPVALYHHYAGHDNNRDWYMFALKESQLAVGQIHNVWHPHVVYDVHQMGANTARMFVPPFLDPSDPNVDPLIVSQTNMLGTALAADLASAGKKGVVVNAIYDFWTPARHYQAYHGGLRVLTESASARLASPVNLRVEQLDTQGLGYNAQRASWNHPDPWKGGEWRLRDIVDYQLITFQGVLFHTARNREVFLRNFLGLGKKAVGWTGSPFAFLVPPGQTDPAAAAKLLNTLRLGLVEIERAKARFVADSQEFPAGTYVIRLAQPYGNYAKTLLERQRYPDLREYPGGPPKRPYDVSAHTLPLLMGVHVVTAPSPFVAELELVESIPLAAGNVEPQRRNYLLSASSNNAYLAVNRLLMGNAEVGRLKAPIEDRGRYFPAGTFVIRKGAAQELARLGIDFRSTDLPLAQASPLRAPRIGIYKSYVPSMDEGWTRWLLDQFEFSYATLVDNDVRKGNLKARFDIVLLADQSTDALVNGRKKPQPSDPAFESGATAPVPEEFRDGLGSAGVEALRAFVLQGGTLITLNGASQFAIERLGVGARNVLAGTAARDFYVPGSILRINIDTSHPLGYGMQPGAAVWAEHSPVFAPAFDGAAPGAVTVASYPNGNPLMSGWLLGDALLQNRAALMDAPLGRGRVILFGFRPQYRAQSYGTFKMLFNALYYFNDVAQGN